MGKNETNSSGWRANKWVRAAIPALLLHCSIGTVYCWSIFSQEIADYIGFCGHSVLQSSSSECQPHFLEIS